jgi:hypothetical protein
MSSSREHFVAPHKYTLQIKHPLSSGANIAYDNHPNFMQVLLFCDSQKTLIDTRSIECFHSTFKILFLKNSILIYRPQSDD